MSTQRIASVIGLLALASPAWAAPEEHAHVVGAKAVSTSALHEGHASMHFGGGLFYERSVVEHLFDAELSVSFLAADGVSIPIELMAKIPFHITADAVVFAGVGPLMQLVVPGEGETAVHFGVASAVGAYYWMTESLGLMLSVNVAGVFEEEFVPEVGGALGFVARM